MVNHEQLPGVGMYDERAGGDVAVEIVAVVKGQAVMPGDEGREVGEAVMLRPVLKVGVKDLMHGGSVIECWAGIAARGSS